MPIFVDVPDIVVPVGDHWTTVVDVPATFPLDDLAAYLAVEGADLDVNARVAALSLWSGNGGLVASGTGSAPAIEAVGGVDMLRMTTARNDRLVVPPAPAGLTWADADAAGFTFAFPVKLLNTAIIHGLLYAYGFVVRAYYASGNYKLQVQKAYAGGTQNIDVNAGLGATGVVAVTYDVATNTLKLYHNGALISTSVSVNWGALNTGVGVYGSNYNPGSPSEGNFGDLVRYRVALPAVDVAAVSAHLMDRFGIA